MMNFESFVEGFGLAAINTMNMSLYRDYFQCSCGENHWFDERINILYQGYWKVVVRCPNDADYLTSLKIKTFMVVKFKGFESLAGTQLENQEEREMLRGYLMLLRDAGPKPKLRKRRWLT
jgi:hypothetical protein